MKVCRLALKSDPATSPRLGVMDDEGIRDVTSPAQLIAYASTVMTLYPGDVIFSGTSEVEPVVPGDVMTLDIPRIGRMDVPVSVSPNARPAQSA